jgi:hypothetical protein
VRIIPLLGAGGVESGAIRAVTGLDDLDSVDVRLAPRWMRLLWRGPVAAMTIAGRVFVAPESLTGDPVVLARLLVHECCHVRQWRQAGTIRFVVRYLGDYVRGRVRGLSHEAAYRGIRYEAEARRIAGY